VFHIDPKSIALGVLIGFVLVPRVVALVQAKTAK
jgi:hypothetical protein